MIKVCGSTRMVEEAALMESLQAFFTENGRDIHSLARYIQRHVDEIFMP
jgi:hypothetical protein